MEEKRTISVEYEGLWRRRYISRSNGSTDHTTAVWWFQTASYHIDLRIPQESHVVDRRTGFAGITVLSEGNRCEWRPEIAFPELEDSVDAGFMRFENPDLLYETGVDGTYEEEWYRVPNSNMRSSREEDAATGIITYTMEGDQWKATAKGKASFSYKGNEEDKSKWTEISVFERDLNDGEWKLVASTHQ